METVELASNLAVRTSNQQSFDKRLIAHIVSLVEQGVTRRVLVVRAMAAGMSIEQAAVAYQITSAGLIKKWIKGFKEENVEISVYTPTDMAKKKKDQSESAAIKALRKELEFANMKVKALDTMIDIAEEQLNIRKKSGAKQS